MSSRRSKLGALALAVVAVLAGVSVASADGTSPVVSSVTPGEGSSVQSAPQVSATYNQALHATSTLVVKDATDVAVAGTSGLSGDGTTITFSPGSTLTESGSPYTATATVRNSTNDHQVITTWTFSIDTTAPVTPAIASVHGDTTSPALGNDPTPTIVVTNVTPGDTVRVLEGATVRGTATVAGGATTATFNAGPTDDVTFSGDGAHTITATSTDPAGNVSPASASFVYTLDTSAPGAPTINSVNGSSTSPATANDATPTIVVGGVAAGDTVRILDGGTVRASKVVPSPVVPGPATVSFNAGTSQEATLSGDGPHSLTADTSDPAGNVSAPSTAFVYNLETGPPAVPTIASVRGVTSSPAVGSDPTPTIVVGGVAGGDVVKVYDGATLKGTKTVPADATTVTFNGGGLDTDVVLASDGDHTLTATSTDPQGNPSPASPAFVYTLDTGAKAPALQSTSPAASSSVQPPATVGATYDERLDRSTSSLTVTNGRSNSVAGTVGFSGDAKTITFTPASTLTEAGSVYTAQATVRDGNGNTTVSSWTFGVDTTAPGAPTIASVNGSSTSPATGTDTSPSIVVSGVQGGHTVRILEGDTVRGSKVVPVDATTVSFNAAAGDTDAVLAGDGSHTLTATATDPAGNTSTASTPFVYGLTTSFPGEFHGLTPSRILDTRNGTGGVSAPVGAGSSIDVAVAGRGGVPATGASAVVINVTATQPSAGGYLTVYPAGTTRPVASNVNFVAGQTVPNLVVAKLGGDGKVSVYNQAGTTHVIFDVVGWFGAEGGTAGSRFNPLAPARILDTRNGTGGFSAPVGADSTIAPTVVGVGGVPATGVSAVIVNVTVTQPSTGGYLTVYPNGASRPVASNLNFVAGQTVPNLVVAKVGTDGKVRVYNQAGTTHVIFDVVGWYSE